MSGQLSTGQSAPVSDTVFIADIKNESNLFTKSLFYFDSNSSLPIQEVIQNSFYRFKATTGKTKISPDKISSTLYLRILLNNNTEKEISAYLTPGVYFTQYNIYKIEEQGLFIPDSGDFSAYKKITLPAGKTDCFLLQIKPLKTEEG